MDVQTKICPKCKIEKSVECYNKHKNRKDGLQVYCKDCQIHQDKQYRQNNPEKEKERVKKWRQENPEKVRERKKKFHQENPEYNKQYYKQYRQENAEKERERKKKYRQENLEKVRERNKKYKQENKEKINKYLLERLKTDPKFKLDHIVSCSIYKCLKSKGLSKKETGWEKAVGYTVEHLKEYLEKQFDDKMTWENHGTYWHIDHIKPKSLFEYDSVDHPEFKKCWSLDNLRPLEAKENLKKSNKYSEEGE
jgi:hypothetical protein